MTGKCSNFGQSVRNKGTLPYRMKSIKSRKFRPGIPLVSPKESGKYYSFPVNTDDTRNFFFIFLRLKGGRDEKVRLGRGKVLEEVKIKFSSPLPPRFLLADYLFLLMKKFRKKNFFFNSFSLTNSLLSIK